MHVPTTISERLHFLAKKDLSSRPKILIRVDGKLVAKKVSMLRLLDWLAGSALESRGFKRLEGIARDERVSMREAVKLLYDYADTIHPGLRAFIQRNKKSSAGDVVDELPQPATRSVRPLKRIPV